jgi:uncharacterized protein YndB with AHSA1/START domain
VTTTAVSVDADPEQVFAVLVDVAGYPDWLVGARAVRGVDADWPAEGSAFRHVIGVPPLLIPGSTTATVTDAPRRLELRAGMGPLGAAEVRFGLRPRADGGTDLSVDERFVAGPAGWTWRWARPLVGALVWGRNALSLQALRDRIEHSAVTS